MVLSTFTLVTDAKKAQKIRVPDQVLCIYYSMQFQKYKGKDVLTLLNSRSKVYAMILVYAAQLGLKIQKINIGAQKIDES